MDGMTQVLRYSLKETYKNIVAIVLLSVGVLTIVSPSFFLFPIPYALIYCGILIGPLTIAANYYIQKVLLNDKIKLIPTFFEAFKKFGVIGLLYSILFSLFIFIVVASWWQWFGTREFFSFVIASFQTYFVGMILVSQIYTIPLIVKYQYSLKDSVLLSVKLLIKYPLYTLSAFLQLVSIFVLLLFTVVGVLFLYPGIFSMFTNIMTSNVMNDIESNK